MWSLPTDREKSWMDGFKYPVNMLKKQSFLVMFPSGSRHSSEIKGGVWLLQVSQG